MRKNCSTVPLPEPVLSGVDLKTLNLDPDQGPDPDPGLPHTNNFDRKNSKYFREKLFSIKH